MFKRLFNPQAIYTKRAQRCLDDARMAALEHETAAEHHAALARMYRERVVRLGRELSADVAPERSLILDPAKHPRVAALRRNTDGAGSQPFLAQGSALAG